MASAPALPERTSCTYCLPSHDGMRSGAARSSSVAWHAYRSSPGRRGPRAGASPPSAWPACSRGAGARAGSAGSSSGRDPLEPRLLPVDEAAGLAAAVRLAVAAHPSRCTALRMRYMPVEPIVSHSFSGQLVHPEPPAAELQHLGHERERLQLAPSRRAWPGSRPRCAPRRSRRHAGRAPGPRASSGLHCCTRCLVGRGRLRPMACLASFAAWPPAPARPRSAPPRRPPPGAGPRSVRRTPSRRARDVSGSAARCIASASADASRRVHHDPVHAVVHDRADRSRHRRHHHRRARAQRLHHDAADEVLEGREHERLAGLEGALEGLVVHRPEEDRPCPRRRAGG